MSKSHPPCIRKEAAILSRRSSLKLGGTVLVNLLFICSENRLRSPAAEEVFSAYEGIEAIGAGTNADAATTVSGDLIEWADIVFVMERSHRNKISKKFRSLLKSKRLVVLNIPDDFDRMDPALISLLKVRVSRYIALK